MKPLHSALRSALSLPFAAAALLVVNLDTRLCGTAALSQTVFDSPEVRAASDVVPPALLAGPHYRVDPAVRTFSFMNQYSVTSDYGAFAAPSDARLRRLVREITATGLPQDQLVSELSRALPDIVDKLTPHGRMPNQAEISRW
jgi:YidB-like protein